MKTRVMVVDTKFDINEGVTVCHLLVDIKTIDLFDEFEPRRVYIGPAYSGRFPKLGMSDRLWVHAVARTREGDTFDEAKGKRIAMAKASRKAHDVARRVYEEYAAMFTRMLDKVESLRDNCALQCMREDDYIRRLGE